MTAAPDAAVATLLEDAGLGSKGVDLWEGPPVPAGDGVDARAIFVLASGGGAPSGYCDGGAGRHDRRPRVQITVRSSKKAYEGGKATANAAHTALVNVAFSAPPSGYVELVVVEGSPTYLGLDDSDHHRWSINVELWRHCVPEAG